jgi:hypothetical protein
VDRDRPAASAANGGGLLCASVGKETVAPGIVVGRDLAFASTFLRFAGALVARQQYVPALQKTDGASRAVWRPVVSGVDADRLTKLARAMPDACRTLHGKADTTRQMKTLPLLTEFVAAVVDHLVRSTLATEPRAGRRAAPASFDSPHDACLTLRDAAQLCGTSTMAKSPES